MDQNKDVLVVAQNLKRISKESACRLGIGDFFKKELLRRRSSK